MSDRADSLQRVALVITGGTIDSLGASRLDLAHYGATGRRLAPAELLALFPETTARARVTPVPFRAAPSAALGPDDWIALARQIDALSGSGEFDGVIVTYGTSTVEEAAYFAHLVLRRRSTVVFVGAMRPPSGLGTDAGINLVHAIEVALSPQCRDLGAVVVMNGTVFSARDVTKASTYRPDAFRAVDAGPLGCVDADGTVIMYRRPQERVADPPWSLTAIDRLPRVDVTVFYPGADGALIDAAVLAGARGIVSAGSGAGRVTPAESAALAQAATSGVVVCRSTRTGSGRVARSIALREAGMVAGNNLPPWKLRVLLMLALTTTSDPEMVQRLVDDA